MAVQADSLSGPRSPPAACGGRSRSGDDWAGGAQHIHTASKHSEIQRLSGFRSRCRNNSSSSNAHRRRQPRQWKTLQQRLSDGVRGIAAVHGDAARSGKGVGGDSGAAAHKLTPYSLQLLQLPPYFHWW